MKKCWKLNEETKHLTQTKHNYTAVPTAQIPEQDFFYYVTDEDKEEVLAELRYSERHDREEERIGKYW